MVLVNLWRSLLLVLSLLVTPGCSRHPLPLEAADFRVGATRAEILEAFGTPRQKQSFHKTGDAIWGPIEEFWPQVPDNGTVEVWAYNAQGGTVELYFIDGSNRVQGIGFAPEGAVFEAGTQPARISM